MSSDLNNYQNIYYIYEGLGVIPRGLILHLGGIYHVRKC